MSAGVNSLRSKSAWITGTVSAASSPVAAIDSTSTYRRARFTVRCISTNLPSANSRASVGYAATPAA